MAKMFGYPQPTSILSDNPTLKEWLAKQGRSIENILKVQSAESAEGLHIWVYFINEPDVVAYRCFPELNHQILPPLEFIPFEKYSHYQQLRVYGSSIGDKHTQELQGWNGKEWVKAEVRGDDSHG
jgi:hypothetical protein